MNRTGGSPSAGPSPAYAAGGQQQQEHHHHHHHHYPQRYHQQHHQHHQHQHQQFHVSVPTAAHASSGAPYQRQESHDAERRMAVSPAPSPHYPAHEHPPQHHHRHGEQGGHTGYEEHRRHPTHHSSPYDERHPHHLQQPHHQHHAYGNHQPMHRAPHAPGYPPAPPEGRASSAASTPGYPAPHHHHQQHQSQQQHQQQHQHHSHHASHSHAGAGADCTLPHAYGRPQEPHQHQERNQQREPSLQPQYQHHQHHHQQVREPSQLRASSVQSMASVAQIGHSRAPSLAPSAAAGVPSSYAALDRAGGPHPYPQAYHPQPPHQPQQRLPVRQGAHVPRGTPRQPLLQAQGPPMTVSIGTRGNDRSTNREGLTAASKGFVLHAPGLFGSSWHKTPANPANGLGGIPVEDLSKDDFKFYCDPCQKGFNSKRLFDTHMEDHVYCEFPGCKFTCRKGKEWKMELHVTALHNRPDAPNLEDNEAYVRNRKSRFPTVETVQTKVEELYYKASRGEVLPDERRRWLKQHGVFVSRKWYLPVMREGDAALEESRRRRNEKRARQGADPEPTADAAAGAAAAGGSEEAQRRPPQPGAEASSAAAAAGGGGGDDLSRYARKPGERMLPLGPNGRYTKSQLVQMARERYENAQRAPAYYVCNRCGEKGHWVEACPKAKDATFDFEARWAGPKPVMKPAMAEAATEHAGDDDGDGEGDAASKKGGDVSEAVDPGADTAASLTATADGGGGGGAAAEAEDNEMTEVSAKAQDVDPALREQAEAIRRVNGPALEARLASAQQRSARRAATAALEEGAPESEALAAAIRRARMRRMPTGPPKATLWDRLTEDQRMNEHSVLLQAIRFFRLRNYFDAAAPAGAPEGGDAPPAGDASEAAAPDDNLEEV